MPCWAPLALCGNLITSTAAPSADNSYASVVQAIFARGLLRTLESKRIRARRLHPFQSRSLKSSRRLHCPVFELLNAEQPLIPIAITPSLTVRTALITLSQMYIVEPTGRFNHS